LALENGLLYCVIPLLGNKPYTQQTETYFVQYRNSARVRKHLKIGVHEQISTEEARTFAKKHLGEIAHGQDPAAKKKENRDLLLIKDLSQDYLDRYAVPRKKARSAEEDKKLLRNIILPSIGNQQVKRISRRTIESFVSC
jgi:hypothetical protein